MQCSFGPRVLRAPNEPSLLVFPLLTLVHSFLCARPPGLQAVAGQSVGHDHHVVPHCRHPVCLPGQRHHLAPLHSCDHKVGSVALVNQVRLNGNTLRSQETWALLSCEKRPSRARSCGSWVPGSPGPQLVTEQPLYYGHLLGGLGDPARKGLWGNFGKRNVVQFSSASLPCTHFVHWTFMEHLRPCSASCDARASGPVIVEAPPGLRTHTHMHTSRSLS